MAAHPTADEILRILYPRGAGDADPESPVRRLVALPDVERARLVLPAERRLAGHALRHLRRSEGPGGRMVTSLVAGALGSGVASLAPRRMRVSSRAGEGSVEDRLAVILDRQVRVSIFLGPPRANRKPVLQVWDPAGDLIAVAKVGVDDLTSRLATAEAKALQSLAAARLTRVMVPQLLAEDTWQGHAMVVQSPVRSWGPVPPPGRRMVAATDEIARSQGTTRVVVQESDYLTGLRERVRRLPTPAVREPLLSVLADSGSLIGPDAVLEFGSWHGDLTRWNMAVGDAPGEQIVVWDWERFEVGVPVGFDALHQYFLPSLKVDGPAHEDAGRTLIARAPRLLAAFGIGPAAARLIALLYLVEIAARFSGDDQASTGVVGGDVARWLLPAVAAGAHGRKS